jgi:hypothetical protein
MIVIELVTLFTVVEIGQPYISDAIPFGILIRNRALTALVGKIVRVIET